MSENNTQMTPIALDVLERLSGWTEIMKFKESYLPRHIYTATDNDGTMWMYNDHGVEVKRLEHMEIDGKVFVRDPQ